MRIGQNFGNAGTPFLVTGAYNTPPPHVLPCLIWSLKLKPEVGSKKLGTLGLRASDVMGVVDP